MNAKHLTITSVRTFTQDKEGEKITKFIFKRKGGPDAFLSAKQVASATTYNDPSVLVGSKLAVSWRKVGDKLLNGQTVTSEESIVDEFDFKLSSGLMTLQAMGANDVSFSGALSFDA